MLSKRHLLTAGGSALAVLIALPAWADDKAPKKKYIIQVPITFDTESRPVVDLFIGEAGPYRFMIDTGSFSALIKEDLAKSLKLHTHGVIATQSLAGSADREYIYEATDVLLGNVFHLPSIDMVGAPKLPHNGVDGILPASILTALPTELDYEGAMVRYYLNEAPQDLTGFVKLNTLSQADSDGGAEKIYAHVKLDGRDLLCLVDTGASGHLFLSGAFVSMHGLWKKYADAGEAGASGVNGETVKTRLVKVPNFEFGPVHFDDMWVTLGDPGGLDNLLQQGIDGLIGDDLLRQFTLAFAEHHAVYVKPNSRFSPAAGVRPMVRHAFDAKQPVLPFLYRDDRRILLVARAGDKPPVGCLVNSGLTKSAIGPAAAQSQGLAPVEGGFDGAPLALDGLWHAPHLVLEARAVLDHHQPAIELGLDLLTAQATRLDFDVNEMTLFADGTPDLTGYSLFAERKGGGRGQFVVTVKLAGVDTVCVVDTAVQASLRLLPHTVKARNLWDAFPDAEVHKTSTTESRLVKMAGFEAAGLHRDTTPVLLSDPASTEDSPDADALLGMGFLHRCNWIFTPDGKLYAKPNSFWTAA